MKVSEVSILHGDGGWRTVSFLKIATACGIVGWAEFYDDLAYSTAGLTGVVEALSRLIIGQDPRRIEFVVASLQTKTVSARSGLNQHAIGAITNALLDIKAKDLGVPVHALFGGHVRDAVPLYWTHCATYRQIFPETIGKPPLRALEDIKSAAHEVRQRGFRALKTNLLPFDGVAFRYHAPGFWGGEGFPELEFTKSLADGLTQQIEALREGAGPDVQIFLDANVHFRTDGYRKVARLAGELGVSWLEMDMCYAGGVASVRDLACLSVAGGETLYGRKEFLPYFTSQSLDVAIVDILWNGFVESVKIAQLAELHEVNVAPHNFYGFLADHMAINFAAAVPNLRIMEIEMDDVPWKGEFVTEIPEIVNGNMIVPHRPGWGTDVNENAVMRRPPRS